MLKEFLIKNKKNILRNMAAMALTVAIVVGVFVFWSQYKVMWFCDEIYSLFTANSGYCQEGRLEYGTWYDSQFVIDDLTPEFGQFYRRTIHNSTVDDHPPIYFLTLHTVSLLMRPSTSKWIGLWVNLLCVIGIAILAYLIFYGISKKKVIAIMGSVALCILPSLLTNSMLIRMYCMQTAWAVLFVYLSYLLTKNLKNYVRYIICFLLACTTTCGFLTQYYFAVFAVGFTICIGIYYIIRKEWKNLGLYFGAMVLSVVMATIFWKSWIDQIFSAYCGEEVLSQAANFSTLFKDIKTGFTFLPQLMFYDFYILGMVLIAAGIIFLIVKKDKHLPIVSFLFGSSFFYSLIVAHVTPSYYLDYRYFYMAVAVAYIGVIILAVALCEYIKISKIKTVYLQYGIIAVLIAFNLYTAAFNEMSMGYVDKSGEYNRKRAILANEYGDIPWVYYGWEGWSMMETYYDLTLCQEFILYNDTYDFTNEMCPGEGEDFLFIVNTNSYNKEEIVDKLKDTIGCDHEIEYLFNKGGAVYLIKHVH